MPPDPAAVPPLKPRPYYLAVDLYERLRTARARRLPPRRAPRGVRILCYHRVADDGDVLAVTPAALRRQLEAVLASGARIVRLQDALRLLARPVEEACVCVTFDDGYRDTLEAAAPLLAELGVPGTLYLPSQVPGGQARFTWYRKNAPPALSRDEVRELAAGGVIDVQSHSRTHPRLPAVDDAWAREEIAGSKAELEALLGRAGHQLLVSGRSLRAARGRTGAGGRLPGGRDHGRRHQPWWRRPVGAAPHAGLLERR